MEALLEMEEKVERWNDDRLDELSQPMDNGFKELRGEMREGFAQVNGRLDRQNHTLLVGALGVIAALIANGVFG